MSEHTPTPWESAKSELADQLHLAWRKYTDLTEEYPHGTRPQLGAMLEFCHPKTVERAVNCHDELVTALKEALSDLKCIYGTTWVGQHSRAEVAIAKAEKEIV